MMTHLIQKVRYRGRRRCGNGAWGQCGDRCKR